MRWSPNIIGPWVARLPANHAWGTITRADEMERNGWDECGVWRNGGMKFVVGKTGETPRKTYPDPFRPPRSPLGVTEKRTRDPSGVRRASNRMRHEAASIYFYWYYIWNLSSGVIFSSFYALFYYAWVMFQTKLVLKLFKYYSNFYK